MAEQEPVSLSSTFPNPPSFWKDFTPERVARLEKIREQYAESNGFNPSDPASLPHRLPDLPEDLTTLQPPPEPADRKWRVFGDQYMLDDELPTLEDQGILNLPARASANTKDAKPQDRAFELKKLTKSLLLNFLELAGIMSRNPSHAEHKVQDLRTILINIHHILNEYRPHQARESAIKMMEDHLDRTRAETAAIQTQVDKAKRVLEGLGSLGAAAEPKKEKAAANAEATDAEKKASEGKEAKDSWSALDSLIKS